VDRGEDKFKQWVGWVTDVQVLNPEVTGVGRKTIVLMNEPNSPERVRLESTWTAYMPPAHLAVDVTLPGLFNGAQSHTLTNLDSGRTRVETKTRIRYTSWFIRLLEPVVTPSSTRKQEQDLAKLKALVEKAAAP
jgi:hypothetical protein